MNQRVIALLCGLLLAPGASAYSINTTPGGFIVKWKTAPIGYYLDPAGSDDISNGSDVQAVLQSFADWQGQSCSSVSFDKLGDTSTSAVIINGAEPNGLNELIWVEDSSWEFGQYTLGVTSPLIYTNGAIVEADIAFNGYLNKWSTTGQFGRVDVKSVAIHEIGHMFGMQHNLSGFNQNNPPTMAPTADPYGKTASLESDDIAGACFLYPSGTHSCSNDADCPFVVDTNQSSGQEFYSDKLTCNAAGKCAFGDGGTGASGTKGLGEECLAQTECKDAFFCQPLAGGDGYCSQACEPAQQNCPTGFGCFGYQNGDGGACLPVEEDLKAVGELCNSSNECESELCYPSVSGSWQCRFGCQNDSQCSIPGDACFLAPGMPSGGCLPESLIPSYKVIDGDPCNEDADCESGICVLTPGSGGPKFCRPACDPAADSCSPGFECAALGPLGGACVPAADAPPPLVDDPAPAPTHEGGACSSGADCTTSMCFGGVCTRACNVVSPSQCAAEEGCQRLQPDGMAGACLAQGGVPNGHPCNDDTDCDTRYCEQPDGFAGKRCLSPCPAGGDDCTDGDICATISALTLLGGCAAPGGDVLQPEDTGTVDGGTGVGPVVNETTRETSSCTAGPGPSPLVAPTSLLLLLATLIVVRRGRA